MAEIATEKKVITLKKGVEGGVVLTSATSQVVFIGETISGVITLTGIKPEITAVFISLSQTTDVYKHHHPHHAENVFETRFQVPLPTEAREKISAESPFTANFSLQIPKHALPTLRRENGVFTNDQQLGTTTVIAESGCHLVVGCTRDGKPEPKVLGSTSITLITKHLQHRLKSTASLKWKAPIHVGGHLHGECTSGHLGIGEKVDFSLTLEQSPFSLKDITNVKLCERLLCSYKHDEDLTMDQFMLFESHEKEGLVLDEFSIVWTTPKVQDIGIEAEGEALAMLPLRNSHGATGKGFIIDSVVHQPEPVAITVSEADAKVSFEIGANCKHQSMFSNKQLFNFWMLIVTLNKEGVGKQEVHLGPMAFTWAKDTEPAKLEKVHHHCQIL